MSKQGSNSELFLTRTMPWPLGHSFTRLLQCILHLIISVLRRIFFLRMSPIFTDTHNFSLQHRSKESSALCITALFCGTCQPRLWALELLPKELTSGISDDPHNPSYLFQQPRKDRRLRTKYLLKLLFFMLDFRCKEQNLVIEFQPYRTTSIQGRFSFLVRWPNPI